jgi:hypothetical protein
MAGEVLPEGIKVQWNGFVPGYREGNEILNKYCASCVTGQGCEMQKRMRMAMGENYPLWFEAHVPVRITRADDYFGCGEMHVFCEEFKSRQQNLPGIPKDHSDGVERLLEVNKYILRDCLDVER